MQNTSTTQKTFKVQEAAIIALFAIAVLFSALSKVLFNL